MWLADPLAVQHPNNQLKMTLHTWGEGVINFVTMGEGTSREVLHIFVF